MHPKVKIGRKIALIGLWGLFFLFLHATSANAQFTTVTATVTDSNGIPYAAGTVSAILTPSAPGGFMLSGNNYSGRVGPATLDSTGTFIANFGDVTLISPSAQWLITIDSNQGGIAPPLGTGAQTFSVTSTGTVISGSSVNISAMLTAAAPKLTNFAGAGTGTIAGTITAFHIPYASAGNTLSDISGSAVTGGTGAIALTATAVGVTPLSLGPFSSSQTAGLLDIHNGGTGSVSTALTVRGLGLGSFTPGGNVALVNFEEESDAAAHNALVISNRTANIAKLGVVDSLLAFGVQDAGLANICGGGAVADSNNNYTCFFWDVLSGITVGQPTSTGTNAGRVTFSVASSVGQTGNLLNFKTLGGAVLSSFDVNGNYSAGTDNSLAGTVRLANSAAAAHTILASGATTTNTIKGFATVPTTGDVVTCTVVATTCTLTDGGAPSAAPAFSAITGGTNTTAAMICGTGCSFATTGSATFNAVTLVAAPFSVTAYPAIPTSDLFIGTTAGVAGNASVSGTETVGIGTGAFAAMTTPASGAQPQFGAALGWGACPLVTTARDMTCIGGSAGAAFIGNGTGVEDGINTLIGTAAGFNLLGTLASDTHLICIGEACAIGMTHGGSSVLVGDHAGSGLSSSTSDVILGNSAAGNTSGNTMTSLDDIMIGDRTAFAGTGAFSENVFIGHSAGQSSLSSNGNVLIGSNAGSVQTAASNATCVGFQACHFNSTGSNNTAFGSSAAASNTGSGMTAMGNSACSAATSGGNDTCIGASDALSAITDTNETLIGFSVTGAGSNTATIGNASVTDSFFGGSTGVSTTHAAIVQASVGTQIVSGADYTNSTVTPSTVFSWTLPATAAARTYKYTCDIMWESTGVTLVGPVFGVNISSAPTQLTASASVQNALAGADVNGYLSNTTTGSQTLVTSGAAGVTSTNYWAKIWGTIEGAAAAGSTFIINAASTSGTTATLNIRRGSGCYLN
jgi:hypothetical protein